MVKKIFLSIDSIIVMILIIIGIGYSYYAANVKYMDNQKTVILADIINLDVEDKEIKIENEHNYEKSFVVENLSDQKTDFNILLKDTINEFDGNLFYELYEGEKLIVSKSLAPNNSEDSYIKLNILLDAAAKKKYTLKFITDVDGKFSANLSINSLKINTNIKTATNYILLNNNYITKTDNDIYYYENGDNNNVLFNDEAWKIVKIDASGNIKIVKDSNISGTKFSEDSKAENSNSYDNSELKKTLQNYYNDNLKKYEAMLVQDNYCNDINIVKNENYKTSDADKNTNEYKTDLECSKNKYYIGTLTYDEASLTFVKNANYANSWTISKAGVNSNTKDNYVWYLNSRGILDYTKADNNTLSVRPTVTLKATNNIKGSGSLEDPYIFME